MVKVSNVMKLVAFALIAFGIIFSVLFFPKAGAHVTDTTASDAAKATAIVDEYFNRAPKPNCPSDQ